VYHTNDNLNLQLSNTVNEYTIDLDAVYQSKINSSFYRKNSTDGILNIEKENSTQQSTQISQQQNTQKKFAHRAMSLKEFQSSRHTL
jgi:hypothetical protein